MESKPKTKLSLKKAKVSVRKDLFGTNDCVETEFIESSTNNESALNTIWGESEDFSFTQPLTNSLLLSPALKRSPNRFSTSPSPKKRQGTPKKHSPSPRKLSKYSPFRKKVHNPNPKNSIKNFFNVKERNVFEGGIKPLTQTSNSSCHASGNLLVSQPSTSAGTGTGIFIDHTDYEENNEDSSQNLPLTINSLPSNTPEKPGFPGIKTGITTPESTQKNSKNITPVRNNGSTTPQSAKKTPSPSSKITGSKEWYSSFLLMILMETVMYDSDPEQERLFSETDYTNIDKYNKLDQPSQRLYARLLSRKRDWIRTASMKYGDVELQLMLLEQTGFITADCTDVSIETLLNVLTLPDLKALCKDYKLPETGVKSDVISRLVSRAKQRSIKSFFSQSSNDACGENNLRMKIYKKLGPVIKVTSSPQETFSRCLLFFSYPHYHGLERDRFSDQLALVSRLRELKFPVCDIVRTRIFYTRDSFLMYEGALHESSIVTEAKEDKDYDVVLQKCAEIYEKLQNYLGDERIRSELEAMPDWLRRFTAGACWVRGLSSGVEVLRKFTHSLQQAEETLQLLLSQRLFGRHRRGLWFEQLALLYQHNLKDNIKATHAVLRGLRDEYIDQVSRHMLSARAVMLEKRKTNGLKDHLKDSLAAQRAQVENLEDPPAVTISELALNSNKTGRKMVYVQDVAEGKMLSSVEEVAREHFRQQGYTQGGHDEGSTIKSLVFSCFWDEIYGEAMVDGHGVFHSEYQTAPLDWNSESFYERRKEKFKSKLQDLAEEGVEAVLAVFQDCYMTNFGLESVVNWKCLEHFDVIESLIRSLNIDVFLNLSRLLLRHHKTYGAGFPDLTLWDPDEKKCIFVEVKSPNDQLSMKQRVWLHMLNKMGANAVVCHVQSVGCRSLKRKASPARSPTKE